MFKNYRLRDFDFKLVIMVLALASIGVLTIGSAEESLQTKQLVGVISGAVIMLVASLVNYTMYLKLNWLMYLANLILLILVIATGEDAGGAQWWLKIGGLQFQPSETAKILLILFFAQFIMKYKEKLNTFRVIVSCIALMLVPWALVFKQPDLSTSIVLLVIFCVIMYTGGISYKLIVAVFVVVIPAAAILVALALQPEQTILKDYQRDRILAFIYPEEYADAEAYQQLNSIMAIGSGQ